MLLVLDAGNTNIHVGCFEGSQLRCRFAMGVASGRTADEYALLLSSLLSRGGCEAAEIEGVMLGSVVPSMTETLRDAIQSLTQAKILTVGPGIKTGFPIKLDNPAELGADLAANAAGAIAAVGYPAVIVDCGTANSVMVLDKDGAYIGGCIMPGVNMSLEALHDAELLPGVLAGQTGALGKNTRDCVRAGVLQGGAMAVQGFVQQYRKNPTVGAGAHVVVTGGSAKWLLAYLPKDYVYKPLLTLEGLLAIWHQNQKK